MTRRLHELLAVSSGVKSRTNAALTNLHRTSTKDVPYQGLSRTYQPRDDDGERFPAESTEVQLRASEVLAELGRVLGGAWDLAASIEIANQRATADVIVNDVVVLRNVPVGYMLYLEKQLTDVRTFVEKLPTLNPADRWTFDENQSVWNTEPVMTTRTKKIVKPVVMYHATEQHPAQVQAVAEDVVVGYWSVVKFSGALTPVERTLLLERVDALRDAVKAARERANALEVEHVHVADKLLNYVLLGQLPPQPISDRPIG